jgi:hypothetical protein
MTSKIDMEELTAFCSGPYIQILDSIKTTCLIGLMRFQEALMESRILWRSSMTEVSKFYWATLLGKHLLETKALKATWQKGQIIFSTGYHKWASMDLMETLLITSIKNSSLINIINTLQWPSSQNKRPKATVSGGAPWGGVISPLVNAKHQDLILM